MFQDVFNPIISKYRGLPEDFKHTSDMDASKIEGNINEKAPVKSTRFCHFLKLISSCFFG